MFNCFCLSVNKWGGSRLGDFYRDFTIKLEFSHNTDDFIPKNNCFDKTIERLNNLEEVAFVALFFVKV